MGPYIRDKALRGAAYFDEVLSMRTHVAGDRFSMADIAVVAASIFAGIVKLDIPTRFRDLHAWHERMLRRPSVESWRRMG